jgi:hypothetical protein
MVDTSKLTRQEAIAILWMKGILHYKLHAGQKSLYDSYKTIKGRTLVWACSRRLGKSYALCLLAIETCMRKPNAVVKYVAPQQKQVKTIIMPIIREILKDCPKNMVPQFKTQDNCYRFPNGSEIQLAGSDNQNAEGLRGGASDLCVVDEAGFCDDLEYVVQSILLPTTATTGGKIILASTPPKTADHQFVKYIEKAALRKTLVKKTVYDNPMLTPETIQELMDEAGGEDSVAWQREYLCELKVDDDFAVVPEFSRVKQDIIKPWPRPAFFDHYVAMDIGVNDYTFLLFGYYDFRAGKLIIEDEFVLNGQKWNTEVLAAGIKEKEMTLFGIEGTTESKKPYKRVSDINLTVLNDLHQLHKLAFTKTQKDDADGALNNMRVALGQKKVIIHPRCETLIFHLEFAVWNKSKTKIDRSVDHGHYDGVDALKYLVRNIDWRKNPYPDHYDLNLGNDAAYFVNKPVNKFDSFKALFNIKS